MLNSIIMVASLLVVAGLMAYFTYDAYCDLQKTTTQNSICKS
jgi:hypothetical protein